MHPSSIKQRKIKTLQRETEKHSQQGNGYRASSSWQQIRVFKTEDLGESKEAEEGDTESKIESFEQKERPYHQHDEIEETHFRSKGHSLSLRFIQRNMPQWRVC